MKQHAPGVLQLIGNTPLVEVTRIDTGPCRLFVKLEMQNPGGSVKDRIGVTMVEAAERDGRLKPGGTIVEATAGNTGIGLALAAVPKGYKVVLTVPEKMSAEKIAACRSFGAQVRVVPGAPHCTDPAHYKNAAKRIAAELGAFYADQFSNPANPAAHEQYTAPEIYEQMQGDVDAVVVGIGSGGTLTGIGRYMKRVSPKTKMIVADPEGSIFAPLILRGETVTPSPWKIEGVGNDFVPDTCDLSLADTAYAVPCAESLDMVRLLLKQEGLFVGLSSGALLAAAVRYCREQAAPKRVVTFACDRGDRYLSKL